MWAIASHFMVIACRLYGDSAHHMAWQLLRAVFDVCVCAPDTLLKNFNHFVKYFQQLPAIASQWRYKS